MAPVRVQVKILERFCFSIPTSFMGMRSMGYEYYITSEWKLLYLTLGECSIRIIVYNTW